MLSDQLHRYHLQRCFTSPDEAAKLFGRRFHRRKTLYFDEVENANVWSFYLVDRDLHHTFEEYIRARGLTPYAIWSRPGRESATDDIGRATFPISETASLYRKPVPKAGEALDYVMEVLEIESNSAILGFLGYRVDLEGVRSLDPSVAALWLRVFVRYRGDERNLADLPQSFNSILRGDLVDDL